MRRRLAFVVGVVGVVAVSLLAAAGPAVAGSTVDRTLTDSRITESSGLAVSALHPGVLYTHNDSGDGPRVFAVDRDGATAALLTLRGAPARDWEAMSSGRRGSNTIWLGDIGDNIDAWGTYRVYRVTEPKDLKTQDVAWTKYELRYADGKSRNAESLLINPNTGRLYVVAKEVMGNAIYEAPATLSTTTPNVLHRLAGALPYATDAAFSPDGEFYVVRGYVDAEVYRTAKPGKVVATIDLPAQPQGESIAWSADGTYLYAGSEGEDSKVYRVSLPASVTGAKTTSSASAPASPGDDPTLAPSPDPSNSIGVTVTGDDGLPRGQVLWLGAGALVLIALGSSLRAWSKRDPDDA